MVAAYPIDRQMKQFYGILFTANVSIVAVVKGKPSTMDLAGRRSNFFGRPLNSVII
jgi:hypothetical protein